MMKHAIVTGATKGIGLSVAKMLLSEGYHVLVTYAHDENAAQESLKELHDISSSCEMMKVDQSDKAQLKSLAEYVKGKSWNVDCLVLNAGMTLRKSLQETTDEDWEAVMQVNVNSNVYLIRDLYEAIAGNSRIVFIGSLMGVHPHGTSLAYGVTKSAVHSLALNLVKCFEGTGTTVNVIAPGFVETPWQKEKPEYIRKNICEKTALKRFAQPEEIADAVRFCLNNQFVNGSIIEVSGGYSFK